MPSERRTKLIDALVRVLCWFLTPIGVALPGAHDEYLRDCLLPLAGHGDGHVLAVTVALLLAILTGRSDLCIAGVSRKTRSPVLLIALSCELDDFYAVVYTKENVAAKALADQISDLSPPTQSAFGRLLSRIEEGKGEAYATRIDVRCSDRNRVIAEKRILIATGGSATAEMAMKYSSFSLWLSRAWLAFMDESQHMYGNYHEIAALAAIQQPALIVFVGDHRQTPGGLSKGRAAAANRQKLLHRPLGLRALNRPGDYLPPARLTQLIALLWPDASQNNDSDVAYLLKVGQAPHTGVWTAATTIQHLPTSLARLFSDETLRHLNVTSCLISAILAVLLIATAPEEFGIPECTTTVEAAGLDGPHRWGIMLPNSSRVSLVTYKAIVAVRYPELVLHDQDPIQIGHFVPHDHTAEHGGFRTVLWEIPKEVPKDLLAAIEDVVVFLNYLQKSVIGTSTKERQRNFWLCATAQRYTTNSCNMVFRQPGLEDSELPQPRRQLVGSGGDRKNSSGCSNRVWFPQRGSPRSLDGRQGRLFWTSHSSAHKSNQTHVHCLSYWYGWDDWDGSDASGLSLWVLYPQKQTCPVPWT